MYLIRRVFYFLPRVLARYSPDPSLWPNHRSHGHGLFVRDGEYPPNS